jgi:DNA-binding GntR family transcriptional regulator
MLAPMTLHEVEPGLDLPALPPRASTAQTVATVLRSQIAAGRILPGAQLREERIAAALEVSRNTVREAFRLLSHERLVEHSLHRGVFVRVVGPDEIRDVYLTRRLVEPLGLRSTVGNQWALGALRATVDRAQASAAAGDWDAVGTADIEFHRLVVAACGSVHLSAMVDGLLAELRLAFLRLTDLEELHRPFVDRNGEILGLLEVGEAEAAVAEMGHYLTTAETLLLEAIAAT